MKKWIWIGSGLFLTLLISGGIYYYHTRQVSQKKEEIISYMEQFEKAKITAKDDIGKKLDEKIRLFNSINEELLDPLNVTFIYTNLDNAKQSLESKRKEKELLYQNLSLLEEEEILSIFNDKYSDQHTFIKNEYHKTKISKKLSRFQNKKISSKKQLEGLFGYVDYLIENQNDIKYFDSVLYYEKENIGAKLKEFQKELQIDTKIEKGTLTYTQANIPILMYHGVSDNIWGISSLFVSPKDFDEQMKYISENGYTPIFMHEIEHLDPSIKKPIVITFDDGNYDLYTDAFPILKKYNIKSTIFIITGFGDGVYSMTLNQAKELSDSGLVSLQSHTVTHKPLATLSLEQIEMQLKESKETLEKLTGKTIHTIAYPTGSYDKRVIEIAKKYYKYGLLAGGGTANINQNMSYFEIKRIGIFRGESLATFKAKCETSSR